jgi:hypothetical protein
MRLRFPAFCFFFAGLLLVAKGLILDFAERKFDVNAVAIGVAALGVWRLPRADTNWRGWIGRWLAALGILAALPAMILLLSVALPSPREGGPPLLFRLPISIGFILLVAAWMMRCWENSRAHRRWRIGLVLALAWYPVFGLGAVLGWGGGYWPAGLLWIAQGFLLWPPRVSASEVRTSHPPRAEV